MTLAGVICLPMRRVARWNAQKEQTFADRGLCNTLDSSHNGAAKVSNANVTQIIDASVGVHSRTRSISYPGEDR